MANTKHKQPQIDINEKFRHALDIMEDSDRSIFITGRAGTGKSTLLNHFRNVTGKKVAVLAPTGVAALNVKGQTIHSFFRFKPGITPDRVKKLRSDNSESIYRKMERTRQEIWAGAQPFHVFCAPLNTTKDLINDRQLRERGFFVEIDHAMTGKVEYPGRPFIMSETPWQLRRPAPLLGQNNEDIYPQLGYSKDDLARLRETGII